MRMCSFWVSVKFIGIPRFTVFKVTSWAAQQGSRLVWRIYTPRKRVALEAIPCIATVGFLCYFSFRTPSDVLPCSSALKDKLIVWGLEAARNDNCIDFAPLIFTQLYLLPLVQLFLCLLNIGIFFDWRKMLKDVLGRVCKALLICLHNSLCARCWIKTHFCFVLFFSFKKVANTWSALI